MNFLTLSSEEMERAVANAARVVASIDKTVDEDIPDHLSRGGFDTVNHLGILRSDQIVANAGVALSAAGIRIVPYRRYGWSGRLFVDDEVKHVYSIASEKSLCAARQKRASGRPHHLHVITHELHYTSECAMMQLSFFNGQEPVPTSVFSEEYLKMLGSAIPAGAGYKHIIIVHDCQGGRFTSCKLMMFDGAFEVVKEYDLAEHREQNLVALTGNDVNGNRGAEHRLATQGLLKLRDKGIRLTLVADEEEA